MMSKRIEIAVLGFAGTLFFSALSFAGEGPSLSQTPSAPQPVAAQMQIGDSKFSVSGFNPDVVYIADAKERERFRSANSSEKDKMISAYRSVAIFGEPSSPKDSTREVVLPPFQSGTSEDFRTLQELLKTPGVTLVVSPQDLKTPVPARVGNQEVNDRYVENYSGLKVILKSGATLSFAKYVEMKRNQKPVDDSLARTKDDWTLQFARYTSLTNQIPTMTDPSQRAFVVREANAQLKLMESDRTLEGALIQEDSIFEREAMRAGAAGSGSPNVVPNP